MIKKLQLSFDALHHRFIYERPSKSYRRQLLQENVSPQFEYHATTLLNEGILILPEYFSGVRLEKMQNEFSNIINNGVPITDCGFHDIRSNALMDCPQINMAMLDEYLIKLSQYYWGKPVYLANCTGNRLESYSGKQTNLKSWHHDTKRKQAKMMLLLTDVTKEGQRMDFIPKTHKKFYWNRKKNSHNFVNPEKKYGLSTPCIGKAGTIIIFDSNGIHRPNRNAGPVRDVWMFKFDAGKYLFPLGNYNQNVIEGLSDLQKKVGRISNLPLAKEAQHST